MPDKKPINLLHSYRNLTPQFLAAESRMRRFSLAFLSLVIVSGLVIGIVFIILSQVASRLEDERSLAARHLITLSTKERMYLALVERLSSLGAVRSQIKDWGDLLTFVSSVIPKESWKELTVTDEQNIALTFKMDSLSSARELVDRLAATAQSEGKIRRLQLVNVYIPPTGGVEVSISFTPVFVANL